MAREPAVRCNALVLARAAADAKRHVSFWIMATASTHKPSGSVTINPRLAATSGCEPWTLRRESALAALRGQHVLFVGDSVTRHQYITLAYFLETGNWTSGQPNNADTRQWASWHNFLTGTTTRIGGSASGGREVCDCGKRDDGSTSFENRYYLSPDATVRLSFIGWFEGSRGRLCGHGALDAGELACLERAFRRASNGGGGGNALDGAICPQRGCTVGDGCAGDEHDVWRGPFAQVLPARVAALGASVVVLNQGLWGFPADDADVDALVGLLRNLTSSRSPPLRVIWRTTTAPIDIPAYIPHRDFTERLARLIDIETFDAGVLTAGLAGPHGDAITYGAFVDAKHLREPVYAWLNTALLGQLARPPITAAAATP